MNFETILLEINNNIAIIKLNRPDKLNALNKQMFDDLSTAADFISENDNIRALVITGNSEKAFAAGADIAELNNCNQESGEEFSIYGSNVMTKIENLNIPVIAAVNGFALGGGCELSMACHIRFASEKAKFGQPEINLGIIPGYGGTQRLTKIVGLANSLIMNLTGDLINAQKAKEIGLVSEIYSPEELLSKTIEFAENLANKAPIALRAIMQTVKNSQELTLEEGLNLESIVFGDVCGSKDFKEGTTAFLEKRTANFIGE